MADTPLQAGEVVITGRGTLVDGMWVSHGEVQVRRGIDTRNVKLPVKGVVFPTEREAISAGVHVAMGWVNKEFPT